MGVQVVGLPFQDEVVLRVMKLLEDSLGPMQFPPTASGGTSGAASGSGVGPGLPAPQAAPAVRAQGASRASGSVMSSI
jgi:hypothetical protein